MGKLLLRLNMNFFILTISTLVSVANTILLNSTGKKSGLKSTSAKVMFNCIMFAVIFVGILIYNGGLSAASSYTIICGITYGVCAAITYVTSLLSYATGPMNFTVLIMYCLGLLIPTVAGPWIWPDNNPVTVIQWCGVAVLILSLILGIKSSDGKKFNFKWLFFVLTATVTNGGLGIIQQAHQRSNGRSEINMMLIIAFFTAMILAVIYVMLSSRLLGDRPKKEFKRIDYSAAIGSGVCIGFANVANLYLSGVLPAVIFFPMCNGGLVILSTLASLFIFKEKLNFRQSVGLFLGIISLFLICGIF